jgi:hypothetical protein
MKLFGRKTAASQAATPGPVFTVDPTMGDPDALRLCDALEAQDWAAARAILDGRDHDDLAFLLDVAAAVPDSEQWLADVVRADLRDTVALLAYGMRGIAWAWDARTALFAEYVDRDQFAVFHERLRLAEDVLQDVVRRDPGNATAWYGLMKVARGLQLDRDEQRRRFDQAVSHHPEHLRAHRARLQQLCRKWGGSLDEMHAFARDASDNAKPGSPLGALVAEAYFEAWLEKGCDTSVFAHSAMKAIRQAADRSVNDPAYRQRPGWPLIHNDFAIVFALGGDHRRAAEQFHTIGHLATEYPWGVLRGQAADDYTEYRSRTLLRTT